MSQLATTSLSLPSVDKAAINYRLYLVTDSGLTILGKRDICQVVEQAIKGGVSIVQYRDKTANTGQLIETGKKLHAITSQHKVPLIIDDRVDVALAVGCEGVHLGQEDMDVRIARKILGDGAIIGATASTPDEASRAISYGADYLGVGTVFPTPTKKDTKHIIGPSGVRQILQMVAQDRKGQVIVPVVCIGGIGPRNIQRVMLQSSPPEWPLNGVAVVSAIMAADDPRVAAEQLLRLMKTPACPQLLARPVDDIKMLVNKVVQNFAANVALAVGASPIMSTYAAEAADLTKLGGALVINAGTVTPAMLQEYRLAVAAYNEAQLPVLLDPVGAGATSVRRAALKALLNDGYFTVIKGNEAEIMEVVYANDMNATKRPQQRGVDASSALGSREQWELATVVRELAERERCVIVMTGATDYVSDGTTTIMLPNGHPLLSDVTGTGCALGTTISAYLAVAVSGCEDRQKQCLGILPAVLAAMLHYEVAAEIAAAAISSNGASSGPGSFVPAFLDALTHVRLHPGKVVEYSKAMLWTG